MRCGRRTALALGITLAALLGASLESAAASRLSDVRVTEQPDAVIVHLTTGTAPKYRAALIGPPHQLVLDLRDTAYAWRPTPLAVGIEPVRRLSGRQYQRAVARVVIDLATAATYVVQPETNGLAVLIAKRAAARAAPETVTRAPETQKPKAVKVDFKDVELPVFIRLVSEVTGKNFVFDEKVTGKVTVITPKEVPVDELYQLLVAILQFKGYTAVPTDGLIQIIPLAEAKQNWTEVVAQDHGEPFVTRLVPLSFLNANEAIRILTPLVSRAGAVSADLQTNTVILTDTARNVERLVAVLAGLDKEPPAGKGQLHVYALENAEAEELARSLTALLSRQPQAQPAPPGQPGQLGQPPGARAMLTGPVTVTADKTRNSLLIVASPADYAVLEEVIAKLDVRRRQKGKINVYPLEYAEAEDIAKTLATLFARPPVPPPGQPPGLGTTLTGPVTVTADKARNSIVVVAAPEDYDAIKDVIRQLDVRRRQVYVEASIIEVTDSKLKELGVEFALGDVGTTDSSPRPFVGTNFGGITQAAQGPAGLAGVSGLAAGVIKGVITFKGVQFLNVLSFVRALQTEEGVNVLSTPHLLTTDNQKAEIVVGENLPFVSGQSQTSGGNVLTTVERKDVGITLRLTPRVTEGSFVKLDIYQEISALTDQALFDPNRVGPVISKRYATTTVVAKDGETIAIGGLIKDNTNRRRSQVPILGDIPLLGRLFRFDRRQDEKTNLLIFITPTIVKDDTLGGITEKKRKELEKSRPDDRKKP